MNNFSFHPEADEEFVEAVAYYEDCESGLGLDFAREIHAAIQNARDYPALWPQIEDDVRRCLVHRFPFGVLYRPRLMAYSSSPSCTCTGTPTAGNTDSETAEPMPERYGFAAR